MQTNLNIEQIFPMLELNPKQKAWYGDVLLSNSAFFIFAVLVNNNNNNKQICIAP